VDFDLNAINFTETKTNKDRSVPMEPIVREALSELHDRAGDAEYVFTNSDTGTRYTDVKKSFSAACREASITDFRFHDLCHTFGTRLADAGGCREDQGVDGARFDSDNHAITFTPPIKGSVARSLSCQSIDSNIVARLSQTKAADPTTCRNSLM
jgi:hypothetical protein